MFKSTIAQSRYVLLPRWNTNESSD